ncbi:unnamed protein product [Didymodactylos carnosus]|uniref:Uncharacterized protein n=1 Tax=Didymodactylos carnosus TaxID=1234261 RepID=A0A814AKR7_9BILA|nr:unnamed protein product [Didymodactylos carnosus]CAF1157063.1 unnamed protein product [Didymodactylos carnosus]CAF3694112.1 unnamed protein product [Didymodactylos carnosus]CAF3968570.1 unnamed protein product [Didymodactylos carnosus]
MGLCKDENFGSCYGFSGGNGECVDLPRDWNDVVSSLWNDGGPCAAYMEGKCEGGPLWVTSVMASMGQYNDQMSSFRCYAG